MEAKKISCSENIEALECINPRRDRWAVRWDHHQDADGNWFVYESRFDHRPTIDEIRAIIGATIDAETQDKIVNGFTWNGKPVRLTDTTQRNFLFAVYEIDKTGNVDRAPFVGLLEADTDAAAADELGEIVVAMWRHIKTTRAEGIARKEAVDYSLYGL